MLFCDEILETSKSMKDVVSLYFLTASSLVALIFCCRDEGSDESFNLISILKRSSNANRLRLGYALVHFSLRVMKFCKRDQLHPSVPIFISESFVSNRQKPSNISMKKAVIALMFIWALVKHNFILTAYTYRTSL